MRVDPADLVGPVWRRDAVIDFNGSVIRSQELFFVYRTARFEPSTAGRPRWNGATSTVTGGVTPQAIAALEAAGQTVYPLQLGDLLASPNAPPCGPANGSAGSGKLDSLSCGSIRFGPPVRLDR